MTRVALMTHNGNGGAALAVSRLAKGLTINTSQSGDFDFALLAAVVQDKDFSVIKKQIGGLTIHLSILLVFFSLFPNLVISITQIITLEYFACRDIEMYV